MSVRILPTAAAEKVRGATLGELLERVAPAAAAAAAAAAAVDRDGRFPKEAFAELKKARLLGVMAPRELGGEGASIEMLAEICHRLGGACASTGMIYAMHSIKLACLVRHGLRSRWHRDFIARVARDQLLLASSTTEGVRGGDVRRSEAPLKLVDGCIVLDRDASVMSYGEEADAVVTTARRSEDAGASDQSLVVFEAADYTLEQTSTWSTLGMRGTRSVGLAFRAKGSPDQIVPCAYAQIHSETMTPVAHLLWTSVWTGVAAAAVERARLQTRKAARAAGGDRPYGLSAFTRANGALRNLRALLAHGLQRWAEVEGDPAALSGLEFQTSITLLKVEASDLAVECAMQSLRACGLAGYRTDGEASVERHLRDLLSAPLMINNERILADVGAAALLSRTPVDLGFGAAS